MLITTVLVELPQSLDTVSFTVYTPASPYVCTGSGIRTVGAVAEIPVVGSSVGRSAVEIYRQAIDRISKIGHRQRLNRYLFGDRNRTACSGKGEFNVECTAYTPGGCRIGQGGSSRRSAGESPGAAGNIAAR